MAEMITRCPQCGTAFRITPAHLRSASGSVRCGSCLNVFNARENLTEHSRATLEAQSKQRKTPQPAQEQDDALISDDMDIADTGPRDVGSLFTDDALLEDPPPTQTSLFERTEKDEGDEEEDVSEDESWALKLLEDDPTPPHSEPVFEEPYENVVKAAEAPAEIRGERDVDFAVMTQEDDQPAEKLHANRHETAGSAYLDAIEPEPVEFAFRKEKPFWRSRRLLWSGLSLVALLLLLGQIAWLQYPALNRVEPYRSVYSFACTLIGCQLPPQEDLSAVRTSNLVVRSHPRQDNALMVDAILQNTASFRQPFPYLQLTFSDMQANRVAQRRFAPSEYLGGELAGATIMPVNQPIHIALEIVDPGRQAVNYRLDVVDVVN